MISLYKTISCSFKDQNNFRSYFDLKTNKFIETTRGQDLVYEDETYKVMYKSFGEWGQATWFINQDDKSEFFTSLDGQNINFLNGKFYITNISSIWEIENPKFLNTCKPTQYYDVINKKEFGMFESYDYKKGVINIFKDSIEYNPYDYSRSIDNLNFVFLTSFVTNNKLFQITQLKDKTAITSIENNILNIIYQFNEKYDIFSWYNQFRNTKNSQKFLKFNNGYNSFGFIEVENQKIDITKVKFEYDSLQYIKSDNIVNLISKLTQKEQLSKKEVIEFEKATNGTDIKQYRTNINHNGYYPKKFEKLNIETIDFIKSENEYLTQDTEYLFTKENQELKGIFIDYDRTKFFNPKKKKLILLEDKNPSESDKKFKLKYAEIKEKLNEIGQQISVKKRPNKADYQAWISNGWRFNLYDISKKNINGITLFISRQEDFKEAE